MGNQECYLKVSTHNMMVLIIGVEEDDKIHFQNGTIGFSKQVKFFDTAHDLAHHILFGSSHNSYIIVFGQRVIDDSKWCYLTSNLSEFFKGSDSRICEFVLCRHEGSDPETGYLYGSKVSRSKSYDEWVRQCVATISRLFYESTNV